LKKSSKKLLLCGVWGVVGGNAQIHQGFFAALPAWAFCSQKQVLPMLVMPVGQ
jgi:hypothetical protein